MLHGVVRTSIRVALLGLLLSAPAAEALPPLRPTPGYRFVTVDHPGGDRNTVLTSFGTGGNLVGEYTGRDGVGHSFIRHRIDGPFEEITVPGAKSTFALEENARGVVSGTFVDQAGRQHGFVRDRGDFRTIDIPGAGFSTATGEFGSGLGTGVSTVTDDGTILGFWGEDSGVMHGFALAPDGRRTDYDHPDAARSPRFGSIEGGTAVVRRNRRGDVVGLYVAPSSDLGSLLGFHGFVIRDGRYVTLDPPGSVGGSAFALTEGGIVGGFSVDPGTQVVYHGFLWRDGRYTTIDVAPGAPVSTVADIAPDGTLLGEFYDATGAIHGYVGYPTTDATRLDEPVEPPSVVKPALRIGAAGRACISAGRLALRLVASAPLRRARVVAGGRRARTLTGRALTRPVRLAGLRGGRVTVRVTARTTAGTAVAARRVFRACG